MRASKFPSPTGPRAGTGQTAPVTAMQPVGETEAKSTWQNAASHDTSGQRTSGDKSRRSVYWGLALALGSVLGFAFKGIWARYAYAEGMDTPMLLALRFALATPLFWLGAKIAPQRAGAGPQAERTAPSLRRKQVTHAGWHGVLYFLAAYCDFVAIGKLGAGLACVILNASPALVLCFEAQRQRRLPPTRDMLVIVIAWLGITLTVLPKGEILWSGIPYSLAAMASYSWYVYESRTLTRSMGALRYTAVANTGTLLAAVLVLPWLLDTQSFNFTGDAWLWLALIVVFATVLPFMALFEAIRRLGVTVPSTVRLLGPPITLLGAYLLHGETLAPVQVVGAITVLAALTFLRTRTAPSSQDSPNKPREGCSANARTISKE